MKSKRTPEYHYPESFDPTPAFPVPLGSDQFESSRLFPEYVYEAEEPGREEGTSEENQE